MRKYITGAIVGVLIAVTGTATAASLGKWNTISNDGAICSLGREGTVVETSATCVMIGGGEYSVSMDPSLGIKVEDRNDRILFSRGRW